MRPGPLTIAAAAGASLLVGAAIVATRYVVGQTGPATLALLRYLVGFLCLLPPLLASGRPRLDRRDLLPIALLGILQFGVLIVLLNYGLTLIPAARSALLFSTFPLLTMLLAAALGRERLTLAKTTGVLLSIVGVGVVLGEKAVERGSHPEGWIGEVAVLAAAASGAVCAVLYQPYLRKYPTLAVSALAMLAAVGFLAILAAGEGLYGSPPHLTGAGWAAVLFIGVASGVGYYLWLWALRHTTPTRVTVFLALSPMIASGLGLWLLGEPVSRLFLVSLLCVAGGLALAQSDERPPPQGSRHWPLRESVGRMKEDL